MFLKSLFRKDSGRKDSKAISVKPDMVMDERWLSFVDCYYLDKPRLADLLRRASITKEGQVLVIAIPVSNSLQEEWLLKGPLKELKKLFAKHSRSDINDYKIILKRTDDFASA